MNTAPPDNIEVPTTWRNVRRALPLLLLVGIGAGAITFGILSRAQPQYTSEAQIQVVAATTEGTRGSPPDGLGTQHDRATIDAHVRAIKSSDLAAEVIEQEFLADNPEFNNALDLTAVLGRMKSTLGLAGPLSRKPQQARVLDAYYKRLSVYAPEKGGVISIRFASTDPQLAANVCNRLAETYIALLRRRVETQTTLLQQDLQRKIATLTREVSEAEVAVERFRGLAAIFSRAPDNTGSNAKQLDELRQELSVAQAVRTAAAARIEDAREMVALGNSDVLPEVQKSPLIQNLNHQQVRVEKRISELTATLLPEHPRMRQLRAELKGLKRQTTREVKKALAGIEKKAMIAGHRVEEVQNRLDEMRSHLNGSGDDAVPVRQYEEVAESKRAELERLEKRFEVSRARNGSRPIPLVAAITLPAQPSSNPSWAKILPNSALVAIAVLLIGLVLAAAKARLTASRSAARARKEASACAAHPENSVGSLLINVEAMRRTPGGSPEIPVVFNAVPGLADKLRQRAPAAGGFRTLLTGETDQLDPANEAIELLKELSASGAEVMLVDWCLDGRGVAEKIGAPSKPGLSEVLQGQAKFDDVVVRMPGSGVHLIPCGGSAALAAALLDPEQVNLALDALDTAYDHIVVVGKHAAAQDLFEAIQGRFDAGVIVTEGRRRAGVFPDPPGTFLGFEVIDIDLFRLERSLGEQLAQERIARFTGRSGVEARAT
jgi:succinoglycan biosynthesis transport protein ExoP